MGRSIDLSDGEFIPNIKEIDFNSVWDLEYEGFYEREFQVFDEDPWVPFSIETL